MSYLELYWFFFFSIKILHPFNLTHNTPYICFPSGLTTCILLTNLCFSDENWDDFPGADEWSTEEYTGSLADTKVFTPSTQPILDQISEAPGDPSVNDLQSPLGQPLSQSLQMGQQSSVQMPSQSPVPPMVGSLTPAQTQYFSQVIYYLKYLRVYFYLHL